MRCRASPEADPRFSAPCVHAAQRDRGFTLIEALVVIAIVGILLSTAVPSFARMLSTQRASTVTNDLLHDMALARGEAMRRSGRVYLAPVGARWNGGWAVFVDRNDNRLFDPPTATMPADDVIALHDPVPATVSITNAANPAREPFTDVGSPQRTYVLFDGHGYARQRNGGLGLGSFVVTDRTGSVTTVRTICVSAGGRARVIADRAGCS